MVESYGLIEQMVNLRFSHLSAVEIINTSSTKADRWWNIQLALRTLTTGDDQTAFKERLPLRTSSTVLCNNIEFMLEAVLRMFQGYLDSEFHP